MASATDITSLGAAWRFLWKTPSPKVMAVGLGGAFLARLAAAIGGLGVDRWDMLAVAVVLVAAPFVEWTLHLVVLHREPFTVRGRTVDLGAAHRQHHLNPASRNWILLTGGFAAMSQAANAILAVIVVSPLLWAAGLRSIDAFAGPLLTAVVMALVALFHYEWAHLLFHTGYRPRTAYYRRLKRNHRLHHYRSERRWLGITGNFSDRVFGTYPKSRSEVPVSPTARTLGVDPQAGS